MTNPPVVPQAPNPAAEYAAAGVTPEQLAAFAAVNAAQTPAEYAAAANQAGLTGQAWQAAAGQVAAGVAAGPVQAPSFEEQLAEYQQRNAALQAQINTLSAQFASQLQGLQSGLAAVQAAVPQKVDPITESASKVVAAMRDVPASDARNILISALRSHVVSLGLHDLAKLI